MWAWAARPIWAARSGVVEQPADRPAKERPVTGSGSRGRPPGGAGVPPDGCRRPRGRGWCSAHFAGGFADGGVDVARLDVEFLGDVLFGLQLGLVQGLLDLALPDHHQRAHAVVDDLAELLEIVPGHAS